MPTATHTLGNPNLVAMLHDPDTCVYIGPRASLKSTSLFSVMLEKTPDVSVPTNDRTVFLAHDAMQAGRYERLLAEVRPYRMNQFRFTHFGEVRDLIPFESSIYIDEPLLAGSAGDCYTYLFKILRSGRVKAAVGSQRYDGPDTLITDVAGLDAIMLASLNGREFANKNPIESVRRFKFV